MAVVINPKDSKIRIKYKTGVDGDGNDVLKTKTYSKIKNTAVDDDVMAVASDLSTLQQFPAAGFTRVDEKELSQV